MCGINGYIQFNKLSNREEMHDMVHLMNEKIIHRGPDSEGLFADEKCALGMRRLSIIDLDGGMQPIWNESRTKMIIFNGEIYNYREIREKLKICGYHFLTESDTETVLLAYDEYGIDFLKMLDGMFSLAIYDVLSGEWLIARDRAGEKPLYYSYNKDWLIFASELKSIIATNLLKKEIDAEALSTYFQLTYIPAPKTIYKGVFKLMPGSLMKVHADGLIEHLRYWDLHPWSKLEEYEDYEKCKRELREKLFSSVERRMISDVPLGAFLSGGFDSSIVVGIMSQISDKRINTFNIGFNEKQYDESKLAGIVAQKNNTNHTKLILDWGKVLTNIDDILGNIDEPFADSSLIATYAVSELAKQYVTVALTGDAGDELFAGYDKYLGNYYGKKYNKIPKILRKGIVEPLSAFLPRNYDITRKIKKVIKTASLSDYERMIWLISLGFKPNELKSLIPGLDTNTLLFIYEQLSNAERSDLQTKTQFVDFCTVLEGDMLAKVDRASMLASLETRVPMLDKDVIELAFNIPTRFKISGKDRKIILKDTFRDLLPNELFTAPKQGFGVPIGKWLECELKDQLLRYAEREYVESQGIFDYEYINAVINSHCSHKANYFSELWTYFVFQNWYEREMI